MNIIILFIQILAGILGSLALLISIPLFFRFHWPAAVMWGLKLYVSALSPILAVVAIVTGIAGVSTGSIFLSLVGFVGTLIYMVHFISVTRPPRSSTGFEQAFGPNWKSRIPSENRKYFLPTRTVLKLPVVPKARFEQDISFDIVPGTNRMLLCDVWQPNETVSPSGVAIIYLHGSAFFLLDKDYCTRTFFSHLAAQGHVIMDVAYRLAPETDIMGMVHDAKRAVVWMKEHAATYGIDPERIIVAGGSAGAHLALLAAYTSNNPKYTPEDLAGKDITVCAAISLYGSNDLKALYYHTRQHLTTRSLPGKLKKKVPTKMPGWMIKAIGKDFHRLGFDKDFAKAGTLPPLLGGHPDECPEHYDLFLLSSLVHKNYPPTLLIHGEHDIMAPVVTTRSLYKRLVEEQVPAVLHLLPQTDHGFDLVLPKIAPAAHNLFYDVERFVALMAVKKGMVKERTTVNKNISVAKTGNR